jgi:hypothetical protein
MIADKGEVLPPEKVDGRLVNQAVALDEKIREAAKVAGRSFVALAKLLTKMKEDELWKHILDTENKPKYKRFENYTDDAVGNMARSSMFELITIAKLTTGSKPLSSETIEELGVKKAAAIAQLPESKRTQAVIKEAVAAPTVAKVKEQVREILNADLPKTEQKEATSLFARQLPLTIISRYEQLEARGVWMKGVRDGDTTLTLKAKLFLAMIANFEATHKEELDEADDYAKKAEQLAKENAETEKAAATAKKAAGKKSAPKKADGKKRVGRKFSAEEYDKLSKSQKQRAQREGRAPE